MTHDANVAAAADTVLLMRDGRILDNSDSGGASDGPATTIGTL